MVVDRSTSTVFRPLVGTLEEGCLNRGLSYVVSEDNQKWGIL